MPGQRCSAENYYRFTSLLISGLCSVTEGSWAAFSRCDSSTDLPQRKPSSGFCHERTLGGSVNLMLAHEMSAMPAMIGMMPASVHTGTAEKEHGVNNGKPTRYVCGWKTTRKCLRGSFILVDGILISL